ncbi:type II toxin-antitoxin system HicB family antitoxin [uncultured Brachyspira sp.]|uniref:type II toxin-antitoxin system HicB family antitoxin n=1 Tax=uncultured Brachyspira sp. TaxID=221953 RepID=UPI003419282F
MTIFFIKKSLETFTANIYKVKSGYNTVFYDFYGCVSSERTLEETVNNAKIALQMHIDGMLEDKEKIPKASGLEKIKDNKDNKETYYTN